MSDLLPFVAPSPAKVAERRARFPLGAEVTLDALAAADVDALFDELRAAEPVTWIPESQGWLVTSHELARSLLLPRPDVTVQSEQNMVRASLGTMMLTVDRDEHKRQRRPFEEAFRPRDVARHFQGDLEASANTLVDRFATEGAADLAAAFAQPYAVHAAGRLVGLDFEDVERIDAFYADFAGAMLYDGDPEPLRRAEGARAEADVLLLEGLGRAREGSLSRVVRDRAGGELSDEELVAQLRVIMFGAIETIQASVSNTVSLILEGGLAARLRGEPTLVARAVDESIRLIPPVAFVERWACEPLDLGGVRIGAGEFVGVSVLAANHDPAVFAAPHAFDLERTNTQRALSFSFGEHHCLGYHLARLQSTVAVETLLARLDALELVAAERPEGFAFRRTPRLEVRWRAAVGEW